MAAEDPPLSSDLWLSCLSPPPQPPPLLCALQLPGEGKEWEWPDPCLLPGISMKFLPPSLEASGRALGPLWLWVVFMVLAGQGRLPPKHSPLMRPYLCSAYSGGICPSPTHCSALNCPPWALTFFMDSSLDLDLKGGLWCAGWLTLS